MTWWFGAAIAAVAGSYQMLALLACLRHLLSRPENPHPAGRSGVSILKPVSGNHPGFDHALRTNLQQNYPEFELLLGHRDPDDTALEAMRNSGARHFVCPQSAPNAKVGVLEDLAKQARYPILIVNDADIAVPPNYLRDVTAPLSNPRVGVVTCLYRAEGDSWPSRFEALGVATDFAPSALVAPLVGISEFGLGSTLAFRRADLDAIGGFAAVADYLADDYQIGARIHRLGRKNLISRVVVSTRLHANSWSEVWKHQVRWARTIRLSRSGGYAGLPVTFATLWAIVLASLGAWWLTALVLGIRLLVGLTCGWFILRSRDVLSLFILIPARDLYGVVVWMAAYLGNTVEWGGRTLRLDRQGRILPNS